MVKHVRPKLETMKGVQKVAAAAAASKTTATRTKSKKIVKPKLSLLSLYKDKYGGKQDAHYPTLHSLRQLVATEHASVLYPGCWIHATPSLTFETTVYVDNFKGKNNELKRFFENDEVHNFFEGKDRLHLLQQDMRATIELPAPLDGYVDVLMSLSAPFDISVLCSKYVRPGGFLYVNDDFGDASVAFGHPELWRLEAAAMQVGDGWTSDKADLDRLFVLKKTKARATADQALQNAGKCISKRPSRFLVNAFVYLFRKVS